MLMRIAVFFMRLKTLALNMPWVLSFKEQAITITSDSDSKVGNVAKAAPTEAANLGFSSLC